MVSCQLPRPCSTMQCHATTMRPGAKWCQAVSIQSPCSTMSCLGLVLTCSCPVSSYTVSSPSLRHTACCHKLQADHMHAPSPPLCPPQCHALTLA